MNNINGQKKYIQWNFLLLKFLYMIIPVEINNNNTEGKKGNKFVLSNWPNVSVEKIKNK